MMTGNRRPDSFLHQQYFGLLIRPNPASSWNIRRTFPPPFSSYAVSSSPISSMCPCSASWGGMAPEMLPLLLRSYSAGFLHNAFRKSPANFSQNTADQICDLRMTKSCCLFDFPDAFLSHRNTSAFKRFSICLFRFFFWAALISPHCSVLNLYFISITWATVSHPFPFCCFLSDFSISLFCTFFK